jgi:hypothetical protein
MFSAHGKLKIRRTACRHPQFKLLRFCSIVATSCSHDANNTNWSDMAARVVSADPWRFIPTTNGGVHPAWTENPKEFLAETLKHAVSDGYPLLGEFEFRHYPSPRQLKRGELFRDVVVPINGPLGQALFAFAEKTGLPFEIHVRTQEAWHAIGRCGNWG